MSIARVVLLSLALAIPAAAHPKPKPHHSFIRRHYVTALQIALATTDAVMTARNLSGGWVCRQTSPTLLTCQRGYEAWLPTQNPAVADAVILSGPIATHFIVHFLRRHGHSKLARVVPWLFIAGSAAAIGFSAKNGDY